MSGSPGSALSERLASALAAAGVDTMFGLPGGGPNLDMIGAAEEHGIRFVLAHGETEAAIMASTHGLLTRSPTPIVVTRGPGAASVTNGLAQATLDRYPLVVVTDTVPAATAARVAHQRLDQRAMLGPAAKVSATISDGTTDDELGTVVGAAVTWPFGGIHLDFDPTAPAPPGRSGSPTDRRHEVRADSIAEAARLLAAASHPVVIAGMEAAVDPDPALGELVAALGCPVLTTYQAVGFVPTEGPVNAGLFTNGALERPLLTAADLILTVGLDLVEPIPAPWTIEAPVVRISATEQRDDYLPAAVDLVGDPATLLRSLVDRAEPDGSWAWAPGAAERFRSEARDRLNTHPGAGRPGGTTTFGPIELVAGLGPLFGPTTTVTVDAGAHFLAVMPNVPVSRPFGLLISNGLATMGFALPAAIGAALARPGDPVVALTGDGGLSMVLAELETIGRLGLPITVVVFNDSALSLIEIKQRSGHGGSSAVRYRPVDFAAVAAASGVPAEVVTSSAELAAAVAGSGDGADGPRLIDARVDPAAYPHLITTTRG